MFSNVDFVYQNFSFLITWRDKMENFEQMLRISLDY